MLTAARGLPRTTSCLAALLAAAVITAPAAGLAQSATSLTVIGDIPTIVVDDASNGGTAWLHLRNGGQKDAQVTLSTGNFVSGITGRPMATQATFFKGLETTGTSFFDSPLKPGATLSVKIQVANLWEAGESTADLFMSGARHTLRAVHHEVPFNVTLQSAAPDKPRINLTRGKRGLFVLKNDDQMTYPVMWRLFVSDRGDAVEGTTTLQPKSSVAVEIPAPPAASRASRTPAGT